MPEKNVDQSKKYCSYCDHTGIIHEPYFDHLGRVPLSPCPKCILSKCQCQGEDPYYYFKDQQIQDCYCREIRLKIAKINKLYNQSGIDKLFRWKFFTDFVVKNKELGQAKNMAYDLVTKFPKVDRGLFLWGNPGTGKTLLSSIILTELITRHAVQGLYMKISRNFFSRLKDSFHEGSPTYGKAYTIEREFAETDLLIIDDFGVQRDSPWEQETLYNLIDARYEAKKFTIFTSNNNPLKALKDLSNGRILSRIKEMCRIIEIKGEDYREKL